MLIKVYVSKVALSAIAMLKESAGATVDKLVSGALMTYYETIQLRISPRDRFDC